MTAPNLARTGQFHVSGRLERTHGSLLPAYGPVTRPDILAGTSTLPTIEITDLLLLEGSVWAACYGLGSG